MACFATVGIGVGQAEAAEVTCRSNGGGKMGFYCRGCENLFNENQELRAQIKNPWIAVADKLPKVEIAVFVWVNGATYPRVGFRQRKSKYKRPWRVGGLQEKYVTHWMPMPDAPKETK